MKKPVVTTTATTRTRRATRPSGESRRTVLALRAARRLSPMSQAALVEFIEALADREGLAITRPAARLRPQVEGRRVAQER